MRVLLAVLLAFCLVTEATAQMGKGGKRGARNAEAKGASRETADVFHVIVEELRIDLKLTPEQQPLWDAYISKIEALKGDIARQRSRDRAAAQADAPRDLDRLVDVQRDRLAAMEDIAEAGKALYKVLDLEQKATADARLARLVAAAGAEQGPAKPPAK